MTKKRTPVEPPYDEAERCIALRKRSKQGHMNSEEDHKFCQMMFKKYPEWYSRTEARVFNETLPFGSQAHRES